MSMHVAVNPIDCKAHGMCAELLPERIALDDWGYPILDGTALPADLIEHARRAAEACPTFALLLEIRNSEALAPRQRVRSSGEPIRARRASPSVRRR